MSIEQLKEIEDLKEEKGLLVERLSLLLEEKMEPQIAELQSDAKKNFVDYMKEKGFEVRQNGYVVLANYKELSISYQSTNDDITIRISSDDYIIKYEIISGKVKMMGELPEFLRENPKQAEINKLKNEIQQLKADIANINKLKMGFERKGEKLGTTNFQLVLEDLFE
ncbi:hypothetical protein [Terribacillus saccharophilus]|uniref:hypothetical protein n=1 Tax=Terribacillus saccharophilus TaxID=361277 RepID=UPI000C9BA2E0|nr:hypothetical protein [Terribacillus goriensis]